MFRFKLRTLLITSAVVGLFLGLQVQVHLKAKKFVEQMRRTDSETHEKEIRIFGSDDIRVEYASIAPLSLADFVLMRRRCEFTFSVPPLYNGPRLHVHVLYYVRWLAREPLVVSR